MNQAFILFIISLVLKYPSLSRASNRDSLPSQPVLPTVQFQIQYIDSHYKLFQRDEIKSGEIRKASQSSQIFVDHKRSVNVSKIIFWQKSQDHYVHTANTTSKVIIQLKITCGAEYFTKWTFNSDNKIAVPDEFSDMDYELKFQPRDTNHFFSGTSNAKKSFEKYTQLLEVSIKSFRPQFKSVSIDCLHYFNESIRTRLYIFQRLDLSEATLRDTRGEYLKLTHGAIVPCKVHDPDAAVSLKKWFDANRTFEDVTDKFRYDWTKGFVPFDGSVHYENGDDYRCSLSNVMSRTHRFCTNPPNPDFYMTQVAIQLEKSSKSYKWEFICSLRDDQKRSSHKFRLHSVQVEACNSPDYCYLNSEEKAANRIKICNIKEKEKCILQKRDFNPPDSSKLYAEGKVTCFVEIDEKFYASHDYYFSGLSGNYYLLSGSYPPSEVLQIKIRSYNYNPNLKWLTCCALKFLAYQFPSMKLSFTKNYSTEDVLPLSRSNFIDGLKFGYKDFSITITNDVLAVNCHVPLYNSTGWMTITHTFTDDERATTTTARPKGGATNVTTKRQTTTEITTTASKTTTAAAFPSNKQTTTPKSEFPKPTNKPDVTKVSTKETSTANNNKPLTGDGGTESSTVVLAIFGIAILVLLMFLGCYVHRYCTIECLCCPKKAAPEVEKHELKPLKSMQIKLSAPPRYKMSSKDLSVDYGQVVSQGQFSTIYQGNLNLSGKRSVVVKVNKIAGDLIEIASLINDVQMRILAGETSQSIAAIVGAYFDRTAGKVYIAMQSAAFISMREFLTNKNMPMGQMKIVNMPPHEMVQTFFTWLKGVSQGLEFLHCKQIVHGNLAAENILVSLQNTSSVSITGFSHSQQLIGNSSYFVKSRSWTTGWETSGWRWMPMESLRYMEFSKESDIWSFGVLMWEIFSLSAIPYLKCGYSNLSMEYIQKLEFGFRLSQPQLASKEIYRKMESCWSQYGKCRPKAKELSGYFNQDQANLNNYVNLSK